MKLLTKILPLILLIAGMAGCQTENIEPVPVTRDSAEIALQVSVPGMQTPSTRALDADKEKELTTIDVVIFSNTDNTIVEHHRVGASDIGGGTGGNDYQFRVKGIENTVNVTLAVIANAPTEVAAALAAVATAGTYVGASKKDFLLALKASEPLQWDTSPVGYRTIPMYGEVSVSGSIYGSATHSINLTRMLAKVDVVNGVAPANTATPANGNFELTAVHVVNRNTAGLIAPKWNASGVPETPPVTTPNLPAGFVPGMVTWANGNELKYALVNGQTSLESEIYLFESAALSANPQTPNGLRLVFEGNYTSGGVTKKYFYPVDFTAQDGAYMPVLRNHRYLFTITEAAGRGYDVLGEAVAAFGVMSNLRTSLVVVDESGIRHMVWNGEHFLGVSKKAFTVPTAGQQNVELQIATNYTGGWKASVENPADTWLTLGAASGQITDKTLTFNAALSDDEWAFRSGAFLLTAGRLEMRILVTQGEYKIVAEPASVYLLDGTTQHSFKVKSNTQWAVRYVSDPDGILLNSDMIANQSGGNNTLPGDDFKFTLVDDTDNSLLSGKTFIITFYDPTGKANDIAVTVTGATCGCNGTALALRIGNNNYLAYMYGGKCWMVQNSREATALTSTYVASTTYGKTVHTANPSANGYYYSWGQASMDNNACPKGWHFPTDDEANALLSEIGADYSDNPSGKSKWWTGQQGATHGAFAGFCINGTWAYWGSGGSWWYGSSANQYMYSYPTGIITGSSDLYLFSVRCVRNQ